MNELIIKKLTENFDKFLQECMEDGEPKQPTKQSLMRARACIPKGYKTTLEKNK